MDRRQFIQAGSIAATAGALAACGSGPAPTAVAGAQPSTAPIQWKMVTSWPTNFPGLGAGAGNTPLEVFIAVCDRMGVETGIDLFKAMDIAEDLIVPMMDHLVRIDRDALTLGYAGVYSSFLLFAKRSAEKYGLSSRDILVELGRRKTVGGQEDMIEDLALDMARERAAS